LITFVFFLIPGLFLFLGLLLRFSIFGLYRDRLMEFILSKKNDKNSK
jgi:hypothetical protein